MTWIPVKITTPFQFGADARHISCSRGVKAVFSAGHRHACWSAPHLWGTPVIAASWFAIDQYDALSPWRTAHVTLHHQRLTNEGCKKVDQMRSDSHLRDERETRHDRVAVERLNDNVAELVAKGADRYGSLVINVAASCLHH